MERLSFKTLQAVYLLNTEYRRLKEEDYVSEYSCQWHLNAQYDPASKTYSFELERKYVQIDRENVEKLMDRVMLEIGNALYPIRLKVTPQIQIIQIVNYDEIAGRWRETTERCRNKYSGSVIDQYIEHSARSISNPQSLLLSLYHDSFINLYFRNLYSLPENKNERERIEWSNFPLSEMKSAYYCTIEAPDANGRRLEGPLMAILPGQGGQAKVNFTYGTYGEPEEIGGLFTVADNSRQYQKKIQVCLQNKKITAWERNLSQMVHPVSANSDRHQDV